MDMGKGIYTTTNYKGWVVLLLPANSKEPLEISTRFPSEEAAKAFMEQNEPEYSFATNKAFMMAKQAQELILNLPS